MLQTSRVLTLALIWGIASTASGVSLNQVDTFADGTTADWAGGASPSNVSTGGPAGVGDRHLAIQTQFGHFATSNSLQWIGNYAAAGIEAIELDMNQLTIANDTALFMRIYLISDFTTFASTVARPIQRDDWNRYQFRLSPDALTRVNGSATLEATLAAVTRVLVRYDPAPTPTPTATTTGSITARLGLDNIRAIRLGDVNYDGDVDIFDVNLVSDSWGGDGPGGDANNDGTVDIFDVNLISDHWDSGSQQFVPEPSAWAIAVLALGVISLWAARR